MSGGDADPHEPAIFSPLLITRNVASCGKSCKCCGISIFLIIKCKTYHFLLHLRFSNYIESSNVALIANSRFHQVKKKNDAGNIVVFVHGFQHSSIRTGSFKISFTI